MPPYVNWHPIAEKHFCQDVFMEKRIINTLSFPGLTEESSIFSRPLVHFGLFRAEEMNIRLTIPCSQPQITLTKVNLQVNMQT
jgi:hypothetical protein